MKTLALTDGDDIALAYNARGKKDLIKVSDPVRAGLIKLRCRLRIFEGEWYLDTRIGVPYFRLILGVKNPDLSIIRQLLTNVILSIEVISAVEQVDLDLNRETRAMQYRFFARAADGRKVSGGSGQPFIVTGE